MARFLFIVTSLLVFTLSKTLPVVWTIVAAQDDSYVSIKEHLRLGDEALILDDTVTAIEQYDLGLQLVNVIFSSTSSPPSPHVDNDDTMSDDILSTIVSLYTNLGTAYSTQGDSDHAMQSYRNAIKVYQRYETRINEEQSSSDQNSMKYYESLLITAQASFFLGMVFQDMEQPQLAIEAYTYATQLDPNHWSSYSNLGAVYHDNLRNHSHALIAYNHAYELLTDPSKLHDVTDPPDDATFILSQLQYRIGLCLSHDLTNQKCAVAQSGTDGSSSNSSDPEPGNCFELAAHAFSLAIEYDNNNESAKHMLATLTADATMNRASNVYVKDLFDQYAKNFEHSLVQELQYTGFERLRRGFDRAFALSNSTITNITNNSTPHFDIVIDAGCGTGLVGEQFRNISKKLIGVDLSEVIIEKAVQTRPKLYDEVHVGDIITIFHERKGVISLIIAGDSFIYFGNLEPLFESICDGLSTNPNPNGYIAFTLENVDLENEQLLEVTKPNWRWQLTASGRFAHRKEYVIRTGQDHGLELVHYESMDGFRFEHHVEVRGHLFVMMKKSTTSVGTTPNDQEL